MSPSDAHFEIAIALPVWGTFTYRALPDLLPAESSRKHPLLVASMGVSRVADSHRQEVTIYLPEPLLAGPPNLLPVDVYHSLLPEVVRLLLHVAMAQV